MFIQRQAARDTLKASLLDAITLFGAADSAEVTAALDRHLDGAVQDYDRVAPRVVAAELTLVANQRNYDAPADAIGFHTTSLIEDQNDLPPYDPFRVELVPTPSLVWSGSTRVWRFSSSLTNHVLWRLGTAYPYTYLSTHVLGASPSPAGTLEASLLPQVVLRAQVETLRELSIRNAHKPVALRDPTYSQTRNGTPAALADQFMRMWEQQVRPTSDPYGLLPVAGGRK